MKLQTITIQRLFTALSCMLFLCATLSFADPGDLGDQSDNGWCDDGGFDIGDGYCHPCGNPGEYCCAGGFCWGQASGYTCSGNIPTSRCYNYDADPAYCGHVGRPLCEGHDTCYSGVPNAGWCIDCGDLTEPCCLNTSYECDYGKCDRTDNVCREGGGSSSSGSNSGGGCFLRTLF